MDKLKNQKIMSLGILIVLIILIFIFYGYLRKTNSQNPIISNIKRQLTKDSNPLMIESMRQKKYPGSDIVTEQTLTPGSNYGRFLASYKSDGLKINGLLTIPNGQKPKNGWPAIVFLHGYITPSLYKTEENYSSYVDYLAGNGFVVFKIDLRGHADSQGSPGGGYFGTDYVTDTLNAYSSLQLSKFINPEKIGLWGHSMAGNITLRSLAVKKDIKAAVIWAGAVYSYVDQRKYGINDNSYRPPGVSSTNLNKRRQLYEKYGSPSAESVFWQQVAPTSFLNDIKGAIEIHHALDDNVVDIGYSRDLIKLLDKTNVPHEFYEYQSGGHNISGASFDLAMQRTLEFFNKYLKSK